MAYTQTKVKTDIYMKSPMGTTLFNLDPSKHLLKLGQNLYGLNQQKFGILHTSGCLMADVPCLHHLWDGQKDCPDVGQIRWHKLGVPRNMPICMLLGPLWQSCHAWVTHRSICTVVIVMTDQGTQGTISHVQLGHA